MDVIVSNKYYNELSSLDIDIIRNVHGEFSVVEIVDMFRNIFYDKMILDVTALKSFNDVNQYRALIKSFDANRLVFLLPEGSEVCTPKFLGKLISLGIYNFTTNIEGVSYLLKNTNTFDDVANIAKMSEQFVEKEPVQTTQPAPQSENTIEIRAASKSTIIGFRNVTNSSGATTLIYMLKKELALVYGQENVLAIEIDKEDFQYFHEKRMLSIKQIELDDLLKENKDVGIILVDLNNYREDSFCKEIIHIIEPSSLKLNRLVKRNKIIFQQLADKKVILNQSLLQNPDVYDFETETGAKIFYNIPPLDERKRNAVIIDFLVKLGLLSADVRNNINANGKVFGLFRR